MFKFPKYANAQREVFYPDTKTDQNAISTSEAFKRATQGIPVNTSVDNSTYEMPDGVDAVGYDPMHQLGEFGVTELGMQLNQNKDTINKLNKQVQQAEANKNAANETNTVAAAAANGAAPAVSSDGVN